MSLFATAPKTSHQTTPWNICMFGHVSGCPSGLWKISLEDGWDPAWHLSWYTVMGALARSHSPFSYSPFGVLSVLSQSGKRHSSCSSGKSCSTSLSSDIFPQQPAQCPWAQLLFCFRPNTSLALFALDMEEFCLEKKNHCFWAACTHTLPAWGALSMHCKPLGNGLAEEKQLPVDTWTGSSVWSTLNQVPNGAHLRSEVNQLLTKHHSRWAPVYSIGGQHLQVRSLSLSGQEGPFQGPNLPLTAMPGSPCPPPSAKNTLAWWWLYADYMVQNGTASPLHHNLPHQVGRHCI